MSPSESVASTAVYGKPSEPVARTARQIAAAAAKARAAQKKDEDSDESGDDEPRRGGKAMQVSASNDSTAAGGALGIDLGSREGSAGKSGGTTPAQQSGGDKRARAGGRGTKRARGDEEDEEDEEEQDEEPPAKRPGGATASAKKSAATYAESAVADTDNGAGDAEVDSKVYCTCRQFSYGEMIGCDDDECEIEWVSGAHTSAASVRGSPTVAAASPQLTPPSTTSRVSTLTRRPRATGSAHSVSSGASATPRRRSLPSRSASRLVRPARVAEGLLFGARSTSSTVRLSTVRLHCMHH